MYGYVVVNEKNSIVFLDGNDQFKSVFQCLIHSEITSRKVDSDSASSGVGSSTSTEDPETLLRPHSSVVFDSSEISHILLPLILLYRSTSDKTKDPIDQLSSKLGTISISKFFSNFLVLVFADDDRKRLEVSQFVENTIATSFGPLIAFCHTDLTTVKKPKENLAKVLSKNWSFRPQACIDIRRRLFYAEKIAKLKDTFYKISSQLSVFIGNNRCLLLSHGDIIATYNSVESNDDVLKGLNTTDLFNIVETTKCDGINRVDQFWLRSTTGLIPYYVNVISDNVFKNMTLICLVESSENTLIRYLYLFSKQLDQLRHSQDLNRDLKEVRKTINDIHILLLNRKSLPDNYGVAFMKNPIRASSFFKSIWNQIESEVLQINRDCSITPKPRSESRFSISSWKSALSTMSMNSSVFTRITMDEKTLTQKMDILLSYGKKQINSLIQELCAISIINAKVSTLPLFNQCLDKIVKPSTVKSVEALGIGSVELEAKLTRFLQPSEFFLEMYAYRVQFDDMQQEICFVSDEYKEDLKLMRQLRSSNRFSCDFVGNSGGKFTIYYFHYDKDPVQKASPGGKLSISMTAVFPEFINKNLAEKQTKKLLDCVLKHFT